MSHTARAALDEQVHNLRAQLEAHQSTEGSEHDDVWVLQCNLASCLTNRNNQTGGTKDLEEAVELYHKALQLIHPSHQQRPMILYNLAITLQSCYGLKSNAKDLDQAIDFYEEAFKLWPHDRPDKYMPLNNLANALKSRYNLRGNEQDLDQIISLHQDVLQLWPPSHPDRGMPLNNLTTTLKSRYELKGNEQDLNKAIALYKEALQLWPFGHPNQSLSSFNLADALRHRYELKGNEQDLDQAILSQKETLQLWPIGHPNRGASLSIIATLLSSRYKSKGNEQDLDQAIVFEREALQLLPSNHPDQSMDLNNLACLLQLHLELKGNKQDLDEAIILHREALQLRAPGHRDRSMSLNNLAIVLQLCFELRGNEKDLDQAIDLHTEAVQLRPAGHSDRHVSLSNLAGSLHTRYQLRGNVQDLDKALAFSRNALEILPPGHPDRCQQLNNLAISLLSQHQLIHEPEHVTKIIDLFKIGSADLTFNALQKLKLMSDWATFASLVIHESALEAYQSAFSALEALLLITPTLPSQHQVLHRYRDLGVHAVSYALLINQYDIAIKFLEQGRALLWSQVKHFKIHAQSFDLYNNHLMQEYLQVARSLEKLATTNQPHQSGNMFNDNLGAMYKHKEQLEQQRKFLIREIQQLPGCESFMELPPYTVLQSVAGEGPVIIINCDHRRSDVLIMYHKALITFALDDDFYRKAGHISYQLLTQRNQLIDKPQLYSALLGDIMVEVWEILVSSIVDKLTDLGVPKQSRIWWCPTSFVSNIPLHAAGPIPGKKRKYLCDLYVSSYIPTLTALLNARTSQTQSAETSISMLAVSQTDESLQSVTRELEAIQSQANINVLMLKNEAASASVALQELENCSWVHFSCHGELKAKEPFNAAFVLAGDTRLTLLDIVKAHLPHAQFAFLSACHTAELTEGSATEEVLHLAAAMHFCGFPSVVGTMWQMMDEDAPFLAQEFYKYMFTTEDTPETGLKRAARALNVATKALRKKGVGIERWANYVHIGI